MKTSNRRFLLRSSLCVLFSFFACSWAQAILPVISTGETVVFSDDFTSNSTGWTNVVNSATTGSAFIDNSLWSPSVAGNGLAVTSTATLSPTLNIANGSISLYLRFRTDGITSTDAGKLTFSLSESTGNRFVSFAIRPNAATVVEYRNSAGTRISVNLASATFADTSTFRDFKITLSVTDNDYNNPATAEVFVYNTTTSAYTSLGVVSSLIDLDSGVFNLLTLLARNNTNGAAYIDSIAITQTSTVPEPSTYALLFGSIFLGICLAIRPRRR
jgi:hypothetical protein